MDASIITIVKLDSFHIDPGLNILIEKAHALGPGPSDLHLGVVFQKKKLRSQGTVQAQEMSTQVLTQFSFQQQSPCSLQEAGSPDLSRPPKVQKSLMTITVQPNPFTACQRKVATTNSLRYVCNLQHAVSTVSAFHSNERYPVTHRVPID